MIQINKDSKILITGGNGLVGSALFAILVEQGYKNVCAIGRTDGDLLSLSETNTLFEKNSPEFVFHAAARVYGIWGNMTNKALSFYENLTINTNVIEACRHIGVKKICAMGTGAIYPFPAPSTILNERDIFFGKPHPAEDSYAQAKRAMLSMLDAYQQSYGLDWSYVVSCNLFGPRDKFDTVNGHVVPSLIKKFYFKKFSDKPLLIWGNGSAQRDFLYIDDAATAISLIMKELSGPINMGGGLVFSILEIVQFLCEITQVPFSEIIWDSAKPNGQNYRAYNLEKLQGVGFIPKYSIPEGLKKTWEWYIQNPI